MIRFEHVSLSYQGHEIIHDLSFEVKTGMKVVISGKSGIGKSSLFSMILGFVRPSKGLIFFNDKIVDEKTVWNIRRKIAYINQDVSIGDGGIKELFANIADMKANRGLDFTHAKITELLFFFNLKKELMNKKCSDLSGGERQRLAIVIALLLQRKVFLLDEVSSALDSLLKKKVIDYFMDNPQSTILSISHDTLWLKHPAMTLFDLETGKWK